MGGLDLPINLISSAVNAVSGKIGRVGGKAAAVSFTGLKFQFSQPRTGDNSARLFARAVPFGYPNVSVRWTQTGIRVWDAETGEQVALSGKNIDEKHNYNLTQLEIDYGINDPNKKEIFADLEPGTTYRYRFYTVANGETFWSDDQYFTTTGFKLCSVSFDSDGGTAIEDVKARYGKPMPLPQPFKYELREDVVLNYVFMGWYKDAARTIPFTDTSKVKEDMRLYAKWELETPIVDVTGITFDKTSGTIFSNSDDDLLSIVADIEPSNATFTHVAWSTSDPGIANVDQYGHVVAIGPGTAVITCASVSMPNVKTTCEVTVRQRMDWLYLEEDDFAVLPGTTRPLTVGFLPADATETAVNWQSGNPAVATVDASGVVTAVTPGQAVITATATDTTGMSASLTVTVEKTLSLRVDTQDNRLYRQGDPVNTVAYVYPSEGSLLRSAGTVLEWNVTASGSGADIDWEEVPVYTFDGGDLIDNTGLRISTTALNAAGRTTVTVTCDSENGSDTVSFDIDIDDVSGTLARAATLNQTEYSLAVGDMATIPGAPVAADGGSLPSDLTARLDASTAFCRAATFDEKADGIDVTFSESGIYRATAVYTARNITYTVPLTFTVADENGNVRLPVTDITLNQESFSLLEGDGVQLTAEVGPEDAWNRDVVWTTSDDTVAAVDDTGMVTAIGTGSAVITATAADGSDVSASAVIMVENYLQLAENYLTLPVYPGGNSDDEIGYVSLTMASYARMMRSESEMTWELSRLGDEGPHTVLGLDARDGFAALRLLRINDAGSDIYEVTCRTGQSTGRCLVEVIVCDDAMPSSVSAAQTAFEGVVGQSMTLDAAPVSTPALPDDTWIQLTGGLPMMSALTELEYDGAAIRVCFDQPGIYQGQLVYGGANYRYEVPVTFTIRDVGGRAPVMADSLTLDRQTLFLAPGETASLTATLLPAGVSDGAISWTVANDGIATVSDTGVVEAVAPGSTVITAVNTASGLSAACAVRVEDSLTLTESELEINVYVEGEGRLPVAQVSLTEPSSQRLSAAPQWRLNRISGNNLTLRVTPTTSENADGDTLYGAQIELYSISTIGETVYELICESCDEAASMLIVANGRSRSANMPVSVTARQTTYTAAVGEVIEVAPELVFSPEEAALPANATASWSYGPGFAGALNAADCWFSRGISTFSFNEPGRFEAELVYSAANLRYVIPVVFRIADVDGSVPVNGERLRLDRQTLDMEAGETATLSPVFTPADVTNRQVSWTSSNPAVATVSADGVVTAAANGTAVITCTPADTHMTAVSCTVRVEDYLTVAPGAESYIWYLQGRQDNAAGAMLLTAGSVSRMARDGITPVWTLERESGAHARIEMKALADGSGMNLLTTALDSAGTDTYTLTCTAGSHTVSRRFTLTVRDLGVVAPEHVTISRSAVAAEVGVPVTIDFTPVCAPAGSAIPAEAAAYYAGFGRFYDALDDGQSDIDDDSDQVTVAFTEPGTYLLCKYYASRNLKLASSCTIAVGEPETAACGLLRASETDCTVFAGGTSGAVSTIAVSDAAAMTIWGDALEWDLEQVSGVEMTVGLEVGSGSADLIVADAAIPGEAVWRVSCAFGDVTESVDITITVKDAFYAIPSAISLPADRLSGTIGETLALPLGVRCQPSGARLPATGDAYWRVETDGRAADYGTWQIKNNLLKMVFADSGYYTARLVYENGNVRYSVPVYITISDEENVTPQPDLGLYLADVAAVAYPEGDMGVAIGAAVVSDGPSAYSAGTGASYMASHDATWRVTTDNDALSLSLAESASNVRALVLEGVSGTGDVGYTVTCEVGGNTLSARGMIHIAVDGEVRPDATLRNATYYAQVGDTVAINRRLYSRADGSLLQSSTTWNAENLLSAIGYEYETDSDRWVATFYKPGTFNSTVTGYVGNLRVDAPLCVIVRERGQAAELPVLKLPAALTTIEQDAFAGSGVAVVDLRGTDINRIERGAFKNCVDLQMVYMPDAAIDIADDAFYGCINVTFVCAEDSPAAAYAATRGIPVQN